MNEPQTPNRALTTKHRADLLLTLHKTTVDRYDKRREIEWKVTVGLWTAIIVITGFGAGKVRLQYWLVGGLYFALWYIYALVWTRGHWLANELDREAAAFYANAIASLAAGQTPAFKGQDIAAVLEERHRDIPPRPQWSNSRSLAWYKRPTWWIKCWFRFLMPFWGDWSRKTQVLATLVLMAMSTYILSSPTIGAVQ